MSAIFFSILLIISYVLIKVIYKLILKTAITIPKATVSYEKSLLYLTVAKTRRQIL